MFIMKFRFERGVEGRLTLPDAEIAIRIADVLTDHCDIAYVDCVDVSDECNPKLFLHYTA
jgi:hypothetical protein